MNRRIILTLSYLFFTSFLGACAGSPKLIGSYPVQPPESASNQEILDYTARIELDVWDISAAVEIATRLAYDWGGTVLNTDSWGLAGQRCTSLTITVPSSHFEDLRRNLHDLGSLTRENLSGDRSVNLDRFHTRYSTILLTLCSRQPVRVRVPTSTWNPLLTLVKAMEVSRLIITRLIDGLIWIAVIVGPFAFLAWLCVGAWKRIKK